MAKIPHPDLSFFTVNCAILTISDTRTFADDQSGKIIYELLLNSNHKIVAYSIIKDDFEKITDQVIEWVNFVNIDCLILNGGTGVSSTDTTYEVIESLLDKTLSGFGELFRFLSYQDIGSRAIATRSIGGIYKNKLIFALPGSSNGVKLALEKLILPELNHLITQIRK